MHIISRLLSLSFAVASLSVLLLLQHLSYYSADSPSLSVRRRQSINTKHDSVSQPDPDKDSTGIFWRLRPFVGC